MLAAARNAGCERVVYTSTVATLSRPHGRPADEGSYARPEQLAGAYERSKYVAEHEALRAAAAGLPLVVVQPTTPFGPGDAAPTPSGRIVRDFLNGRMHAYVDTALNVVDVDDVADGHLLAAEHGELGASYILGGENLDLRSIFDLLESCTGLTAPRMRLPRRALFPLACLSTLVEGRLLGRSPTVTLAEARIAQRRKAFSDERARRELGYTSRPAAEALARSARWFVEHGAVAPRGVARIAWSSSAAWRRGRRSPGAAASTSLLLSVSPEGCSSPSPPSRAARPLRADRPPLPSHL